MARDLVMIDDLAEVVAEIGNISEELAKCVKDLNEVGKDNVLIHWRTVKNRHLPELSDWLDSVKKDVKNQIKAFKAGVKSKAELHMGQFARQKEREAETPAGLPDATPEPAKKPPKKKGK